jgi:hypothetical protein
MTQRYKMMINITNKTWNGKAIVYHKSANDKGALAMMCAREEEPWPSVTTHWRIAMACTRCKAMDTCCR